jgi:dienelactone hydrolase
MDKRLVDSTHDGLALESFVASATGAGPRPTVLLFPNFLGLDHVDDENAARLVALGYTAFGCDLYGKGNRAATREEGAALMLPLRDNRPLLQARMTHLLEVARQQPEVDAARVAAVGFCFGGLCVLDLARSGADLRGAASFHGLFTPPPNLPAPRIGTRVAVYHGWADALVPPEDGIERVWINPENGRRSDEVCAGVRELPFIAGYAPSEREGCAMDRIREWFGRDDN